MSSLSISLAASSSDGKSRRQIYPGGGKRSQGSLLPGDAGQYHEIDHAIL